MSPQNNIKNLPRSEQRQEPTAPIVYDTPPRWDVLNLFLDLRLPSREDFGRALIAVENVLSPIESLALRRGGSLPTENRSVSDQIAGLERSKWIWSTVTLASFFALTVGAIQTGIELSSGAAGLTAALGTVVGSIFTGYVSWGIARSHADRSVSLALENARSSAPSNGESTLLLEAERAAIADINAAERALLADIFVEETIRQPSQADYHRWSQSYEMLAQRLYGILAKVQHRIDSPPIALLAETRLPGTVAPMEEIANRLEEGCKQAGELRRRANELENLAKPRK